LEEDSNNPEFLESMLSYLVEKVMAQLRQEELRARCVTLKLRDSNFKTVTRSRTLDRAVHEDHVILTTVVELFRSLFTHRTRVRLIGVGLTSLTAESASAEQMDLFQSMTGKRWDRLYRGIDQLRDKYGFRSILRASSRFANGKRKVER
jgi:DNA polymerase-4